MDQRVVGSNPIQGTSYFTDSVLCQGTFGSQLINVSLTSIFLSFSTPLPCPLSLESVGMSLGEDLKKKSLNTKRIATRR